MMLCPAWTVREDHDHCLARSKQQDGSEQAAATQWSSTRKRKWTRKKRKKELWYRGDGGCDEVMPLVPQLGDLGPKRKGSMMHSIGPRGTA